MDSVVSYLSSVYYNTKRSGGYGGVNRLYDDVKNEGKFKISRKQIKEWLVKQDAYTFINLFAATLKETVLSWVTLIKVADGRSGHAAHAKV